MIETFLIKSTLDKELGLRMKLMILTRIQQIHRLYFAIQKNPNIEIFIAIPPIDFPAEWNQRAEEYGYTIKELQYHYFVNDFSYTITKK